MFTFYTVFILIITIISQHERFCLNLGIQLISSCNSQKHDTYTSILPAKVLPESLPTETK